MGSETVSSVPSSVTSVPRAVVSLAIGVAHTVERAVGGTDRTRVAQTNAWTAVRADRERARHREQVRLVVAALAASYRTVVDQGSADDEPGPPAGTKVETPDRRSASRRTAGGRTAGSRTATGSRARIS